MVSFFFDQPKKTHTKNPNKKSPPHKKHREQHTQQTKTHQPQPPQQLHDP